MVSLFRGEGGIIENKKLKGEVEKIDKDIKKLLEEIKKDPFGLHLKKTEEYKKLIEKILEEIAEHKKSLHKLYNYRPNDFPELENLEHYLREYLEILKKYEKGHTVVAPHGWLESKWHAIQDNWHKHKIKFK